MPAVAIGNVPARQHLEIDIPQPGDITAIGELVVDGNHRGSGKLAASAGNRAKHFVESYRVLDKRNSYVASVETDALRAAKRGLKALQGRSNGFRRNPNCKRSGDRRGDVVRVVDSRNLDGDILD